MEEKLSDIEKYYEKIEAERIEKLDEERKIEVSKYSDVFPSGLGYMDDAVYTNYLSGLKVAYDVRIKAEQEAEAERLRLIEVEKETARLKAIEDEKIRKENAKLKAEADAKEKRNLELRPYIVFIRDYNKMLNLPDSEYKKELSEIKIGAEQQWEYELKEQIKKDKEIELNRQKLIDQQNKANILAAELKAKKDAEIKAEQERKVAEIKAKQEADKAAKAPRKEKLTKWVDSFNIAAFENDNIAADITAKFEAYKKWAKSEIEKL